MAANSFKELLLNLICAIMWTKPRSNYQLSADDFKIYIANLDLSLDFQNHIFKCFFLITWLFFMVYFFLLNVSSFCWSSSLKVSGQLWGPHLLSPNIRNCQVLYTLFIHPFITILSNSNNRLQPLLTYLK